MTSVSTAEADVLRCGYDVGYFDKSDIITWADRQIAACDSPTDALLDLSMCRKDHPIDVMNHLGVLGSNDPVTALETQFGFIGLTFQSEQLSLQQAIRGLFALVHERGITDDQQSMIYHLDDGYDLAVEGSYGTLANTESEFLDFVAPYAEQLRVQYPLLVPRGGPVEKDRD